MFRTLLTPYRAATLTSRSTIRALVCTVCPNVSRDLGSDCTCCCAEGFHRVSNRVCPVLQVIATSLGRLVNCWVQIRGWRATRRCQVITVRVQRTVFVKNSQPTPLCNIHNFGLLRSWQLRAQDSQRTLKREKPTWSCTLV